MHILAIVPFFPRGLFRCRSKPTLSLISLFPSLPSSPLMVQVSRPAMVQPGLA